MALRTTCNKNVKFKIIRIRKGCQYAGYVWYSEHLNWATQNLRLGHMRPAGCGLDIADLREHEVSLRFEILSGRYILIINCFARLWM